MFHIFRHYRLKILSIFPALLLITAFPIAYSAPININSADVPTITNNLIDIGPVKATAIIEYRELHGKFLTPEDLLKVKGIGEKTLEKNRENLRFNDEATPSSTSESSTSKVP